MALQRRFWNWKDDDLTFDLARAFIGLIENGLYRGFDPIMGGTLTLVLNHTSTGATRVNKALVLSDKYGIVVTKQGVFIQEEVLPEFTITPTSTEGRKDLIVLTHNYEDIEGGTEALYSVIEGTATAFPALGEPAKQVIIGYLQLPPACTALNQLGVVYTRAKQPNFANHVDFIQMSNGAFLTALDANNNFIINLANPINGQDAATKFYVDTAIANNVVWSSETIRGIIELATFEEAITGADHLRAITPKSLYEVILAYTASQIEANGDVVDNRFITPKTLANRVATETRKGVARIATEAEAILGEDDETIITPFKLKKALPLIPVVLDIGAWNINAATNINLPHLLGADWDKVVALDVSIRTDDLSNIYKPTIDDLFLDATNVYLTVDTAGLTLADFDSLAINRGFIVFWIKKDIPAYLGSLSVNAGADIIKNLALAPTGLTTIVNMSGFIESIGSAITLQEWTVESGPVGYTATILPINSLTAELKANMLGDYVLRLTATNANALTAFDEVTVTVGARINTPPVISSIEDSPSSYAGIDSNFIADYSPAVVDVLGYYKFQATINATDVDGDLLTYEIREISSINIFTGEMGPEVVGSLLEFEQSSPVSNTILVRGMAGSPSTADNTRFYFFKAIVDDGNGGIAEKGFRIKVAPDNAIEDPVGTFITFSSDTNALSNIYQGTTRVTNWSMIDVDQGSVVHKITAFISAAGLPAGSLQAAAYFGNGANGGNPTGQQIVVPVGTIVNIISDGTIPPNVGFTVEGGSILVMKTRLVLQTGIGVSNAVMTLRAYNEEDTLVAMKVIQVTA